RTVRKLLVELSERVGWHPQLGVRHGVIEIDEERTRIFPFDECLTFLREQIVDIIAIDIGAHPLAVPPEMIGELPMGVAVIEEPEGIVEPLPVRLAAATGLAQSPFADH